MSIPFRTELTPQASLLTIDHKKRILCVGSCFAEHIGKKLDTYFFPTLTNPAGVLFHPLAIERLFSYFAELSSWSADSLIQWQGIWYDWDHHSMISDESREKLMDRIRHLHHSSADFIRKADICIITLGTAWVYEYKQSGNIVANCHKHPGDLFLKKRLSVEGITSSLMQSIALLRSLKPQIQVLLTVSPVRHLKDGFHENQLSKASLLLAIDRVCSNHPDIHYFPSYELVLDDLRDYRFFNQDMIHPNEMAIDYIWEAFQQTYFSRDTITLIHQFDKFWQAARHRPFQPHSEPHQTFLRKQLASLASLQKSHSDIDLTRLSDLFNQQLDSE